MQQGHLSLVGPHVDVLVDIASGSLELLGSPAWARLLGHVSDGVRCSSRAGPSLSGLFEDR